MKQRSLFPVKKQCRPGFWMLSYYVESERLMVFEPYALPSRILPVWRNAVEIDGRRRSFMLLYLGDRFWAVEDEVPIVRTEKVFYDSTERMNDLAQVFRAAIVEARRPKLPLAGAAQ